MIKKFIQKLHLKVTLPIIGFFSLIWFLIRVIPKPSRATYPCMQVAFPLASSFIIYLAGIFTTIFAFKKAKKYFTDAKYIPLVLFLAVCLIAGATSFLKTDKPIYSQVEDEEHPVNQPMGEAKGIFPGRVVWIHNQEATNENCENESDDYWWMDQNNNQDG